MPSRRHILTLGAGIAAATTGIACASRRPAPDAAREADETARLDELFADLQDQRASVEPIQPAERAARRARLGRILEASGWEAMVMESGATMRYLSGVSWGHSERLFALVVLADGSHFWLCPAFEAGRARLQIDAPDGPGGDIVTWQEHEYPYDPLASALTERGAASVAIEPSLRHRFAHGIGEVMRHRRTGIALDVLVELRGRKDEHELALIRRANELTQQAIVAASQHLEPGMSNGEIGRLMRHAQQRLGLVGVWNLSLIGPAAAYPHGDNSDRRLERGDVVLVDTGGALHDYQSDNTRSWVFDAPVPRRVGEIWNIVHDAQRAAYEAIRPGVPCGDIDRVAREWIDRHGFGPGYRTFTHRLGHGIGLEGHEDPYFDGGSGVLLAPGMTLSDEPGIYLEGEFGIRLEDIVAVTGDGADHFGSWQRSPASPA